MLACATFIGIISGLVTIGTAAVKVYTYYHQKPAPGTTQVQQAQPNQAMVSQPPPQRPKPPTPSHSPQRYLAPPNQPQGSHPKAQGKLARFLPHPWIFAGSLFILIGLWGWTIAIVSAPRVVSPQDYVPGFLTVMFAISIFMAPSLWVGSVIVAVRAKQWRWVCSNLAGIVILPPVSWLIYGLFGYTTAPVQQVAPLAPIRTYP